MKGLLITVCLLFVTSASHAEAVNDARLLFVTSQSPKEVQRFSVAHLRTLILSEYAVDTVAIESLKVSGEGLFVAAHLLNLAITGPLGPLVVGAEPNIPELSDSYNLQFKVSRDSLLHQVKCRLRFEDQEPVGWVILEKCKSKTAIFESLKTSFSSVGLKPTRREKQRIERKKK